MNRTAGHLLIVIAAFLYVSRYMTAALILSGDTNVHKGQFRETLEYIGPHPLWLAIACAVIGVLILLRSSWVSQSEDTEG